MSHREPNEEVPEPANPPLLKLAVALILTRLVMALSSAWFLNEVATRNEVMAFSAIALVVSIVGAIFGVLVFKGITNLFIVNNLEQEYQLIVKGAIIVGAVLLQQFRVGSLRQFRKQPT